MAGRPADPNEVVGTGIEGPGLVTVTRKVLIIGLDGATFNVIGPLMETGRMPRLKAAIESGASGPLRSTTPPITPAAWTTFLTGKKPGTHGIIDFEWYDARTNKLRLNTTQCLAHVRNLWQIAGEAGLKVGSVNVPMTYPPVEVNGFLVSGFETPGPTSDFVYPPELKHEILARWPDPTLGVSWKRSMFGGDRLFAENVNYMSNSFHQGADMTTHLGDKLGWDVLMVVFKMVDNLQHKTWKYLDPRWAARNRTRSEIAKGGFEAVDAAVGKLLDYAAKYDAGVMMVSDHGHGSLEGKTYPNLLLSRWGFLKLRSSAAQAAGRLRSITSRWGGPRGPNVVVPDIERHIPIDLSRTEACVMHAGNAGFLYINLKGRQPTGIVDPSRFDALRDELQDRLLGDACKVRTPNGEVIQMFPEVHKPEELYGCERKDQPWLPDLLLIPHETLAVVRKIRGRSPVRWLPYRRLEGTHRFDGIFVATGPGVARNRKVRPKIVDCAPTILTMLGLPVPDDMEGNVINDMFETPPAVRTEAAPTTEKASEIDEAYSPEELQQVTERLSDLGYLE
ncbi:MAG: alkaline phosphatase family protein [Phycisphaerae bacterium]